MHSISANVWCSITFFHCLIVMREVICESKMAISVRKLLLVLLLYIGELAIFQSLFHVLEKYCFLSNQYYYRSLRYFFIFTWIAKIVCFLLPWSQRFFLIFLRERDQEEAAKRRQRVAKATRRERKTSGYLGLESHFHADDRVRIWPSSVDWLIVFQTRKPIWVARLIVITDGTLRIFTPHFASLY